MSSSLSASASPVPTSNTCTVGSFTQFPSTDVYCAVGSVSTLPSDTQSVLAKCCKSAPVQTFASKCGYYCLAYDQSVSDLTKCLMSNGVGGSTIFCSGNSAASATGKPTTTVATTTRASSTGTTNTATRTGAAGALQVPSAISKAGLGMLGMVVVSFLAGTMI